MTLPAFETEHFYAQYEFKAPHMLSASDCESMSITALLKMADRTLDELGSLELHYTESQGKPELRQAIADTYKTISAEDVLVLATPIEGIYLTMRTLLKPEDEAIVLTPTYDALKNLPEHLCTVKTWELLRTDTGWELDLDALENLITPKTKLIAVTFPHNPTGFLPGEKVFKNLIDIAEENGVWVYSDEMYRGLEFSAPQIPSACELYEKSITLSGLSKTHGLPGLRSGWLVAKDKHVRDELMNWKMYTSICPSAPVEFLTEVALSVRDELAEKNKKIIRDNVALANPFFEQWSDFFTWRPPLAGSIALVEIATDSATNYCHQLAKEAGVVLLPSAFLGYPDKFVRFGFGREGFSTSLNVYDKHLRRVKA